MKAFTMGVLGIFFSTTVAFAADCTQRFSWLPNPGSDIAGYKIYYGSTNGGPYPNAVDIVAPTPVDGRILGEVTGIICDETYYFVCTAYNTTGVESAYSPQVEAFIPAPTAESGDVVTKTFGSAAGADYLGAIQDTFINLNETNSVASQQLNIYTWPENRVANAIIMKINLSQLPPGAQIESASLQLYATAAGGDSLYDISAHKIINNNPNLSATTGYTYNGTNSWTANTSSYNNIPMAQADISAAESINHVDLTLGYKEWDVTEMVRAWQASPASNYGLLLNSDNTASSNSHRFFASSEATDTNQRPRLVVTYTSTVTNPWPTIIRISFK